MTKRAVVQRGVIVCFVCAYLHSVVAQEEPQLIHVANVERMLRAYLLDNSPSVVLVDDVSATRLEVLRRLSVTEVPTSGSASIEHACFRIPLMVLRN